MADRTRIPSSPACGLWETLLADALDGQLRPEDETAFAAHMAVCAACTAMFEEARRGREWLQFLAPEPDAPAGMLDRILAQTGPGQAAGYGLAPASGPHALPAEIPLWQLSGHAARRSASRLMLTAAMAFFSVAVTLNLVGVRLTEMKLSDLRPAAMRSVMERRLTMASTPIVRYYDHLRLVYEVQSTVREFERDAQQSEEIPKPRDGAPGESKTIPRRSTLNDRLQLAGMNAGRSGASMAICPDGSGHTGTLRATTTQERERNNIWTA